MWIEPLFNHFGVPLTFALSVAILAMPLAATGLWLRIVGKRARNHWEIVEQAQLRLKDVAKGRVAVAGTWRNLGPRAVVEDGEGCVIVEREPEAKAIPEGAEVQVVGYATRQADHPRGGSFRGQNRVWVVEGDGPRDPVVVSTRKEEPAKALKMAKRRTLVGAALLAASVAITVGSAALCWRAADDQGSLYTYSE